MSDSATTCVLPAGAQYDAVLDARVQADVVRYRFKRTVFAALSILLILSELMLGACILLVHVRDPQSDASIASLVVLSSVSAFLLTLDVSFGIRERASSHHATLMQLIGIRNQMRYPTSSPLWQEYGSIKAFTKINYIEAVCDGCAWRLPQPIVVASPT